MDSLIKLNFKVPDYDRKALPAVSVTSQSANLPNEGLSFSEVMSKAKYAKNIQNIKVERSPQINTHSSVELKSSKASTPAWVDAIGNMAVMWQESDAKFAQQIRRVPSDYRSFLELQLLVNRLQMNTEVVSKGAEAVSQSFKRLQQMGTS